MKSGGGDAGGVIIGKEDGYILIGDEADETVIGAYGEPTSIVLTASGEHNTVRLELGAGETIINWGDGHIEEHDYDTTRSTTHAYADDGNYTITLIGDKTTELYISGHSKAKKADITGVDIGTQYDQVVLAMCNLTSLFVPKGVDVSTGINTDVASVVYEDGANEIGKYDHENHQWWRDGKSYFSGCESLTSVAIPDSVKTIDPHSFNNTPYKTASTANYCFTAGKVAVIAVDAENKSVVIPNTVKYINPWFSWQDAQAVPYTLSGVTFGSAVEEIGDNAFSNQSCISALTLPSTLVCIGDEAFLGCNNLATVTLNSDIAIGTDAFAYCPITTLTLSSNLLTIGSGAFNGCKITSVTFPATLTSIGANAFKGNELTNTTIPATVTSIGADAFANNSTLTEIHFAGSTPPTITGAIADASVPIVVPVGAKSAYEAAGYTNVFEEGHMPQDISLTWETGTIDPATGEDATDSMCVRSESTSDISEVYTVKWAGSYGDAAMYQLMVCCYNKSNGTYAGTYNGTSVVQGESWLHGSDDWSQTWNDDLSSLTAYDFRFVFKNKWSTTGGAEQYVVVYGIE